MIRPVATSWPGFQARPRPISITPSGAARQAHEAGTWRRDLGLRKRTLLELSRLAKRDRDRLALLDSLEVGLIQTISRRLGGQALVRNLEYFSTWVDKIFGDVVPVPSGRVLDFTRREPYGVVAAITAWNTPSLFLGSKLGPALAAGNSIVLKPSELGSLSALHLARLCAEAGVPEGVVNIVTGGGEVGDALVRHPGVDKITFTGGGRTAEKVQQAAARNLRPVHLELGGKSPHVVLADADLGRAVGGVIAGAFGLSGQACAAGSRLILEDGIHDAFVDMLVKAVAGLNVGDPLEPSSFLGPLISKSQQERVLAYVTDARAAGACCVHGGGRVERDGYFVEPTIFTDVTSEMTIGQEEIFGPLLSVFRVPDVEAATALANDTPYGLAAGIWTRDIGKAHRFAEDVRAGNVWVNQYGAIPHTVPFGGFGASGHGREGGREGILEYTEVKNVAIDIG